MPRTDDVHFYLTHLLAAMLVAALCLASVQYGVFVEVCVPLALLSLIALGLGRLACRVAIVFVSLAGAIVSACLALSAYPLIVIADTIGSEAAALQRSSNLTACVCVFFGIAWLSVLFEYHRLFPALGILLCIVIVTLTVVDNHPPTWLLFSAGVLIDYLATARSLLPSTGVLQRLH